MQLRRRCGTQTVVLGGFGPRHGERTHRAALKPGQLLGDLRILAVGGAHGAHDFGRTLDADDPAARNAAFDDRRHIFAFGREGQPVDDLRLRAQGFVILALRAHPLQQGALGRVAYNGARSVEESRGVGRHDLGEIMRRKRIVTHQFLHVHPVLGQRAGLVGADDRHGAHRFAGVHAPHEVVGLEHAPHGHRQRQRNAHRKSFGNGHHDDGHRDHENVQHLLRYFEPVALEQPTDEDRLAEHDAENSDRKRNAGPADEFREARQLAVERRLLVALDGRLLGDAARFGRIAHGRSNQNAVTVRHGRTAQCDVRRIGRFGIEMRLVDGFVHLQFAREGRFVDAQRHGFDQLAVRGHGFAAFDIDHVAHDHVAAGNLADRAVAHHLDRNIVVDLIQPAETPHGVPLEPEPDAGRQNNGAYDADRLGEILVNEPDGERQHRGQQQNADDRVLELLDEKLPCRIVFGRRDDVVAMRPPAVCGLLRG